LTALSSLLRTDGWRTVGAIPEDAAAVGWSTGLAFHPGRPLLATLGERDRLVRVWALEPDRLPRDAIDPESLRARSEPFVRPPVGDRGWRSCSGRHAVTKRGRDTATLAGATP